MTNTKVRITFDAGSARGEFQAKVLFNNYSASVQRCSCPTANLGINAPPSGPSPVFTYEETADRRKGILLMDVPIETLPALGTEVRLYNKCAAKLDEDRVEYDLVL